MMGGGVSRAMAAAAVGVHSSTLGRWQQREAAGAGLVRRRGPWHAASPRQLARAARLVRELHGMVGAESLSHSVPGLSRRMAAMVKAATCTVMEHERKEQLDRVKITQPGVLRGFDSMAFAGRHLFVASDGSIPYRTSCQLVPRYTGAAVGRFLARDFDRNGAPLVIRLDRASQHKTSAVRRVLDRHRVMLLHGPPNRPSYYGQLERQNVEHREWLSRLQPEEATALASRLAAMIDALNRKWRRRELSWKTAWEAWRERPQLTLDRSRFRDEVRQQASILAKKLELRGRPADLPERLAIEHALARHGLLIRKPGGWC
jgi:hypothetical protein